LYIRATVLTPNLREAELLTGMHIKDIDDMRHATDMMRTLGVENVVLKAGQAASDKLVYFVANEEGEKIYERPRIETGHTLGAGGTLSTAIAVSLAQKLDIYEAVERSLDYLQHAMETAEQSFNIMKNAAFYHAPKSQAK
jgi:hydroxymethylpyrimidine/phosphomethylpyrimidine kinase